MRLSGRRQGSLKDTALSLRALLFSADGSKHLDDEFTASIAIGANLGQVTAAAAAIGIALGRRLIERGARELIESP